MKYEKYGKDGPEISRLGFGAMRLPTKQVENRRSVDFQESARLMRKAMEMGVNFFDSHHQYHSGESETAIGKALDGWKGGHITIQTKTPWYNDEPKEYFEKLLYEALEKLGVNCIDYLLSHSLKLEAWEKRGKEFLRFTDWAINRGLIRHRGFSSHDNPENIKTLIDTGEFSCMLVSYNWMNPKVRDTIGYAADRGMGVSVMNPMGGGTLAVNTEQILELLPDARSAPEIGLRYVIATPGVTSALSGMNALDQLNENVTTADRQSILTENQLQEIQKKLKRIEEDSNKFCTACGYCMPCEHGVDISGNFRIMNQVTFFGRIDWAKQQYNRLKNNKDGDKSAEACQTCGKCEPKCPNDIPIIRQLEEVRESLSTAMSQEDNL